MDLELTVFLRFALMVVIRGTRQLIFTLYTTSSHDGLLEYIIGTNLILHDNIYTGITSPARRKVCLSREPNISSDDIGTTW
jgi:hypothetical protein